MMRILLTGATGFLGRHCLELLLNSGTEVHAVFHSRPPLAQHPNLHWHQKNLLAQSDFTDWVAEIKPTHLMHLAWEVTPGKSMTALENIDWLKSSLGLIQSFMAAGGKRVFVSGSCFEYDLFQGTLREDSATDSQSLYGHCKLALLHALQGLSQQEYLDYCWGRLFYLYGPGEHPNRLVPSIINALLNNEEAKCSSGEQLRDFMYIKDAAQACVSLLVSSQTGVINIGTGEAISLRDLIQAIGKRCRQQDLIALGALPNRPNESPLIVADISKMQQSLPQLKLTPLEIGLTETLSWWQKERSLSLQELSV